MQKQTNKANSPFMEFVKSYWYILIGLFILVPYAIKYVMKQVNKIKLATIENNIEQQAEINALNDPLLQEQTADTILKNYGITTARKAELKAAVQKFAHYMGTATGLNWWEKLTEDEDNATKILMYWVRHLPKFGELYNKIYTEKRNLKTDFNGLIDATNKQKMYAQQKAFNVQYF